MFLQDVCPSIRIPIKAVNKAFRYKVFVSKYYAMKTCGRVDVGERPVHVYAALIEGTYAERLYV
jgi:hypothetical protein